MTALPDRSAAMSESPAGVAESDDLVLRVRAGDNAAFALIIRRHERDVWKVASAVLDDRVAAENLVQQTFVNAYERLDQYQLGRDVGRWLKGIARNLVRHEFRRRSRERNALSHYRSRMLVMLEADARAEGRERALEQAMAACRAELAPSAARAIRLFYEEGRDMAGVAQVLGRTAAATRLLVFRARLALRACMERRLAAS